MTSKNALQAGTTSRYEVETSDQFDKLGSPHTTVRDMETLVQAQVWAHGMLPEFSSKIWKTVTTRTLVEPVEPDCHDAGSVSAALIEPVLLEKWHVTAYDTSYYGEDCSRSFSNERDAVDYARSREKRFCATVTKSVTMAPINTNVPI